MVNVNVPAVHPDVPVNVTFRIPVLSVPDIDRSELMVMVALVLTVIPPHIIGAVFIVHELTNVIVLPVFTMLPAVYVSVPPPYDMIDPSVNVPAVFIVTLFVVVQAVDTDDHVPVPSINMAVVPLQDDVVVLDHDPPTFKVFPLSTGDPLEPNERVPFTSISLPSVKVCEAPENVTAAHVIPLLVIVVDAPNVATAVHVTDVAVVYVNVPVL